MATGIFISDILGIEASVGEALQFGSINSLSLTVGPWTPPQYALPAMTMIIVPATTSNTIGTPSTPQMTYVFDAVLRIRHRREVRKTSHPVLTGANISDHAFVLPSSVSLEIGMSDAMASYSQGVWVGASTKSISAWQILKRLAVTKTLVTLVTRLDTYQNMLILLEETADDNKTKHALKATITLEELLSASITSIQAQSALPQVSNSTQGGTTQSQPPNPTLNSQHQVPMPLPPDTPGIGTPGSGDYSSNSIYQVVTGTSTGGTLP